MPNIEKRRYPRVDANFEAEIQCEDDFKITAMVLDTSSNGLKLECNSVERDILTPRGEWTRQGKPIEANVTLNIPQSDDKTSVITVQCYVAFSRRVAKDRYHVGLRYRELNQQEFAVLAGFIKEKLENG